MLDELRKLAGVRCRIAAALTEAALHARGHAEQAKERASELLEKPVYPFLSGRN